jgi:hypothetical protein
MDHYAQRAKPAKVECATCSGADAPTGTNLSSPSSSRYSPRSISPNVLGGVGSARIPIGGEARPDGQDTIARSYAADPAFQGSNPHAFLTGIRSPAMVGTTGS